VPDLDFQVSGVSAAEQGFSPLLIFELNVTNLPETEKIFSVLLEAQIQIEAPRRHYSAEEKERLVEVFGEPERWSKTLRNQFWTRAHATIPGFSGKTRTELAVPCSYDLNILGTKYFSALDGGDVPLLFLFSGSVFYEGEAGRLQVQRISWEKECVYRMSVAAWRSLMDRHFPNSAWVMLRRDVFERLHAFKRLRGLSTWEETFEKLLPSPEHLEVSA
jgi:hypothetical protein